MTWTLLAFNMAYRGALQQHVDEDIDGEAAMRLQECGGVIGAMNARPPNYEELAWAGACVRAAQSFIRSSGMEFADDGVRRPVVVAQHGGAGAVDDGQAMHPALAQLEPCAGESAPSEGGVCTGVPRASSTLVSAQAMRVALAGSVQVANVVAVVAGVPLAEPASPVSAVGQFEGLLQHDATNDAIDVSPFLRTDHKRRKKELLQEKWYCQCCSHYTLRSEERCGRCNMVKADMRAHDEASMQRLESRKSRKKGREQNKVGAGTAATVERHADACAPEDHDAAVERELAELGKAIGDSVSNSTEASKQCIIEGFLLLHYKGQYSLSPGSDSEAALGITEHVVANFFNRIGRVVEHGEQVFPFGGYFNAFREDGFSKAAVTELREVVRTQLFLQI